MHFIQGSGFNFIKIKLIALKLEIIKLSWQIMRFRINGKLEFCGLYFNPLNADLNPIRHLLALLGAHHILHVNRIRVNSKYHDLYPYVHYKLRGICTILTL
jgi:predicted metal-dependent peptidase